MATATVNVIDIGNSQQEGHVNLMSKLRHVCTKLVGSSDGQSADQGGLHDSTLQDGHEEGKQAAADVQLSGRDERTRNELLTSPRTSLLQPIPAAQGPIYELSHALQNAFAAERAAMGPGSAIDNTQQEQHPASWNRLDSAVRALVGRYAATHDDWKHFAAFNPHHYVRHLIDATDDFELILICWGPGQVSRVHNHGDSHCWLTALSGSVEEVQYHADLANSGHSTPRADKPTFPGVLGAEGPCPSLEPTHSGLLHPPATGYINDRIALHSVGCSKESPEGAITLHLYSPPIRRVKLYEPEAGRVLTRVPGFYSIRGVKV